MGWGEAREAACTACDGSGVVTVPVHSTSCSPLRCASDCPRPRSAECERCAKAALGEDLVS